MTENNQTPDVQITVETVEADALTLISIIREDLQSQLVKVLQAGDERAHVIVSVVNNGVFVAGIVEEKNGKHRYVDITPESVYELWKLKTRQYTPDKGAWFSIQFSSTNDGFITQTKYNYDKKVFSGDTPENWFVAPETPTELYKSVWTNDEYREDLESFPRPVESLPDWLK